MKNNDFIICSIVIQLNLLVFAQISMTLGWIIINEPNQLSSTFEQTTIINLFKSIKTAIRLIVKNSHLPNYKFLTFQNTFRSIILFLQSKPLFPLQNNRNPDEFYSLKSKFLKKMMVCSVTLCQGWHSNSWNLCENTVCPSERNSIRQTIKQYLLASKQGILNLENLTIV